MVICGNIIVRNNYEEFMLTCLHCNSEVEIEIGNWKHFILHMRNAHGNGIQMVELEQEKEVFGSTISNSGSPKPKTNDNTEAIYDNDCLAEHTFVDLPMSDDERFEDESEADETIEDHESTIDTSETDAGKAGYAPTSKFNPTFYRRSPRITMFIELYKTHPCLWNPVDPFYGENEKRAAAYAKLIDQLKTSLNVHLTNYKLRKCINSLHSQYAAITRQKQTKKLTKLPLQYHEQYSFLSKRGDVADQLEDYSEDEKIKLIFTESNQLTTLFIDLYSKYPELFDPAHKNYSKLKARKTAYTEIMERLTAKMSLGTITQNDVYESVLRLRQWYCRKIKGLTDVQQDGFKKAEKRYIEKCKSFLTTTTFRLKLKCEICLSTFNTDHMLQAHLYREHKLGEWPFKCELCSSTFERRCHLQQHKQRIHVGKLFTCNICDRSFAFLSHLNIHIRTHDETHVAKPFVCEFCGKSFKQKIQMTNHITAVHTKIRAFKCGMCPKDFLTKRDLGDHIKAHLNIRDKVCEICKKTFTNANALVKHRHIHRQKTLQCSLCSTRFSERVSLGVHMKRTHKIIRNTLKIPEILETF